MTTGLGTRLGTRLGTALGTGGVSVSRLLYALTNLTTGNLYATTSGGGEAGDVGGFGSVTLFKLDALVSAARVLAGRSDGGTAGHFQWLSSANLLLGTIRGTSANTDSPSRAMVASDVGRIFCSMVVHTGAGARVRHYVDRQEVGTTGNAITGYTPFTGPHQIGAANGAFPGQGLSLIKHATFRGVPTSTAAILAYFDEVRTKGDLPVTLSGVTFTHAWPPPALLKQLTAPASIPDVVTAASADAMTKTGSPTVTTIDLSIDGRRTYAPIGYSATTRYQSTTTTGIRGAAAGFYVRVPCVIWSSSAYEYLAACMNGSGTIGWGILRNGGGIRVDIGNGTYASVTKTFTAADYGVPHLVELVYDATNAILRMDGAQVGSTAAAFAEAIGNAMALGSLASGAGPAFSAQVFQLSGAHTVPTLADHQAAYAALLATGTLPKPTGTGAHHYDVSADSAAGIPTQITDRVGTDHLSVTGAGAGLALSQRTERVYSYETTPIAYGVTGGISDYYTTASAPLYQGTTGAAGAFFATALIRIASQAVASATRLFASTLATPTTGGYYFQTLGTNSTLWFVPVNAGGSGLASPSFVIPSSLVGKWVAVTGVFDATGLRVRQYVNRAEAGTGTAATGSSYNPSAGPLNILRDPRGTLGSDGIEVIGMTWGGFVPTLAEVQGQHDAIMAAEDIVAIPGKSQSLVSFKRDKNGATVTDTLGGDHLTRVGSPSLVPIYNRAFAW